MTKRKGTRVERELLHMLYKNGWMVNRSAGSGSIPLPNPDLLAGKEGRILAIECKAIKNENKFFPEKEINELSLFSEKFGAEPWIAIKFDNKGWFFLSPNRLNKTKTGNYSISLNLAKEKGIPFESLIKQKV